MEARRNDPGDAAAENRLSEPAQPSTADAGTAVPAAAAGDRTRTRGVAADPAQNVRGATVTGPGYGTAGPGYGQVGLLRITPAKGLLTGLLLVLLGVWGAIVPFVGPYFGYGLGHTGAWYFTLGRLWLDILPGIAVLLGGTVLMASRNRIAAWPAAWLALAGGIWFVVGSQISRLWTIGGVTAAGAVSGTVGHQVAQYMGYFFGLGAVVCILAAVAAGRLTVRGVRDVRAALAQRAS